MPIAAATRKPQTAQPARLTVGARTPAAAAPPTKPAIGRDRVLVGPSTLGIEKLVFNNPTTQNKVTLHISADESRHALVDAIKTAKQSFYIETFIWHNDEAGREVAQALIDRKREAEAKGEAFDAKVLIDWGGLRDKTNPTDDTKIVKFLKDNGIDVREFNKGGVNPLATGKTPITHRKLYIQDGTKFMTGGRNIGDEYLMDTFFNPKKQTEKAWHDLLYTVEGQETGRIRNEFFLNWTRAGGTIPTNLAPIVPAAGGSAMVQSYTTDPLKHTTGIRDIHVRAILAAKQEIRIIYPYFSDDDMVDALVAAKKANPKLKIQVMMPAKGESGLPGFIYSNLNLETARQLMAVGIEVRLLDGHRQNGELVETFSHFKGMVIDGSMVSIGSANGDARTMSQNHELNTLIFDKATAKTFIDDVMEDDWQIAKPVTQKDLDARPWWKKALVKVMEAVDFLF